MFMKLLDFLGGSVLKTITDSLSEAYKAKLVADTDDKKLAADIAIQELTAQRDLLLKEQDKILTSWVRPAFAGLAFILWAKLIVWDTVLGLGVTILPSFVEWFAVLIPTVYFTLRPGEKSGLNILDQLLFRK